MDFRILEKSAGGLARQGEKKAPQKRAGRRVSFDGIKKFENAGVGKSMVTSQLAVTMQRKGYRTAVLDADITGPSIPKAFGVHGRAVGTQGDAIVPVQTAHGHTADVREPAAGQRNGPGHLARAGHRRRGAAVLERVPCGTTWIICSWICLPEPATWH